MRRRRCQEQLSSLDGQLRPGHKLLWAPVPLRWKLSRYVSVMSCTISFLVWCHAVHADVDKHQMLGVDKDTLDPIINEMFFLNGENVNPKLCVGGALRPMLEWALAAMIMYMHLSLKL